MTVKFPAKRNRDNWSYMTLDGKTTIGDPYYKKDVKSKDDISEEELRFLLFAYENKEHMITAIQRAIEDWTSNDIKA